MKDIVPYQKPHNYLVVPRTSSEKNPPKGLPTVHEKKEHPCGEFNRIFEGRCLNVPKAPPVDPSVILYHRGAEKDVQLHVSIMMIGRISEVVGLKDCIPESGKIDVELLGGLINVVARKINWIGADYGCARALCAAQEYIPNEPRFNRLKFLFPGTIIFDDDVGIAIPMVEKTNGTWTITHRNILDQVVPGVDMHVI